MLLNYRVLPRTEFARVWPENGILYTDGMDGNGLNFEKNWPIVSSFDATSSKNPQEIYYGWPFPIKFI